MAIKDVESKCWILALFVRDDGERFLLGDGSYEFTEKQLHFAANTMANDVVEVQGNDGYLLAGQVRRPSTQTFDGYVGDSSTSKAVVEERRRAFFAFFRKNFFYKVIYIFPDGSAIQRKRGFLVDAPEVKELWQIYPQYHVALNFEDINYYYYDEDADGEEIYGKSATINLNSVVQSGGLVWLMPTEVSVSGEGTEFTLDGTIAGTELTSTQLKGDTTQQTYSGKNLSPALANYTWGNNGTGSAVANSDGSLTVTCPVGGANGVYILAATVNKEVCPELFQLGYTWSCTVVSTVDGIVKIGANSAQQNYSVTAGVPLKISVTNTQANDAIVFYRAGSNPTTPLVYTVSDFQVEAGSTASSYEPYVGGVPAPNPDYPQEVQTVTGRQVVTITDGGSQSQEYEINLGKNLCDFNNGTLTIYQNTSNTSATYDDNNITITAIGTTGSQFVQVQFDLDSTKTYTISGVASKIVKGTDGQPYVRVTYVYSDDGSSWSSAVMGFNEDNPTEGTEYPFSFQISGHRYYRVRFYNNTNTPVTVGEKTSYNNVQIELGSTATSYAPYFTPIELCKIGDYQDEPFKNVPSSEYYNPNLEDGAWYLHKEVEKVVYDGSESGWATSLDGTTRQFYRSLEIGHGQSGGYSDKFVYNTATGLINTFFISGANQSVFRNPTSNGTLVASTVSDWTTWLASNPVTFYYALATPTDTQITNADLIAQLEALWGATTYNGSTSFTVDGNGNLAAILAVEVEALAGGGVEWDENGAVWEEGKPSYSIISVDSIDNVYPVLTITGRTVNPVLTDVTTGTIFQYNGTITDSQVLRVDMMNKTATLNGVSVIGNVTGDWLYLAPGNNRVTYTADNVDAPNATVEWQEIVG